MFDFLKKRDTVQVRESCRALLALVRPEVEQLMSCTAGPANTAMAELYGTLYFLWLAREKADWNALLPCLGAEMLDSLTVMRIAPADRKKRLNFLRDYWRTLEKEERQLLRAGRNPLGWLEHKQSGLAGIAAVDRAFAERLLPITSSLIVRLELRGYDRYKLPPEPPAEKLPLSDIRPQPPRAPQFITLTDPQGQSQRMQVLDLITTMDGTFACLRPEGQDTVMILKTTNHADGLAAYSAAEEKAAKLVQAVFRTRNPQYFE